MDTNDKLVKDSLDDIKRQVPGILNSQDKKAQPTYLKDEELFFRAMNKGS